MHLKYKFIILIVILCFITLAFFIQANRMIEESEAKRLQNEMVAFAQILTPYYLSGNLEFVYKMGASFGYTLVESVPKNAKIIHQSSSELLHFTIFAYDSLMGFSIVFLDDAIHFVRPVGNSAWNKYKIFILLSQFAIIAMLAFFLFYQVLRPLNKLQRAINELKSGIYGKMLKIKTSDEIGRLMQTFNEMNEKISRLIKARELITRNIAHELKTPLAKIKLSLSLKDGDELKNDMKRYTDSLERISQNMLEYERIQESAFTLSFEEFLSESAVFEALKDLDGQKIVLNIIKVVKISGDLHLLSIAIKNLIENAIKYSSDGVANIELSEVGMMFYNNGEPLERDISYYFEPFYRGDITQSGYGLGLSIVSEIIALHKMQIEYHYDNGKHIFYIRF